MILKIIAICYVLCAALSSPFCDNANAKGILFSDDQGVFKNFDKNKVSFNKDKVKSLFKYKILGKNNYASSHVPVQNPGGSQFSLDKDFAHNYSKYIDRSERSSLPQFPDAPITNGYAKDDAGLLAYGDLQDYVVKGAKKIQDTEKSGWGDIEYIPPPDGNKVINKMKEIFTDSDEYERNRKMEAVKHQNIAYPKSDNHNVLAVQESIRHDQDKLTGSHNKGETHGANIAKHKDEHSSSENFNKGKAANGASISTHKDNLPDRSMHKSYETRSHNKGETHGANIAKHKDEHNSSENFNKGKAANGASISTHKDNLPDRSMHKSDETLNKHKSLDKTNVHNNIETAGSPLRNKGKTNDVDSYNGKANREAAEKYLYDKEKDNNTVQTRAVNHSSDIGIGINSSDDKYEYMGNLLDCFDHDADDLWSVDCLQCEENQNHRWCCCPPMIDFNIAREDTTLPDNTFVRYQSGSVAADKTPQVNSEEIEKFRLESDRMLVSDLLGSSSKNKSYELKDNESDSGDSIIEDLTKFQQWFLGFFKKDDDDYNPKGLDEISMHFDKGYDSQEVLFAQSNAEDRRDDLLAISSLYNEGLSSWNPGKKNYYENHSRYRKG